MTAKTITLRADLVDRLESLARTEGRTLDDVFGDLLEQYTRPNWALAIAEGMEALESEWLEDDPSASEHSRQHFEQHNYEKWKRTQNLDQRDDD